MGDIDKTMRKALLKSSDVLHDPAAAIDEITRLTEQVEKLENKNRVLEAGNRVKGEFMRTRQCPDHSGKWERGRCLQCEIEELQAECERLKTLGSDYDLEELLRIYTALHDGKVTAHWLWVAIERIGAGESVTECLEDYGYIPEQRADQLQAKLDAVMEMLVYKQGGRYYTGIIGDTDVTDELQQALKDAPEKA